MKPQEQIKVLERLRAAVGGKMQDEAVFIGVMTGLDVDMVLRIRPTGSVKEDTINIDREIHRLKGILPVHAGNTREQLKALKRLRAAANLGLDDANPMPFFAAMLGLTEEQATRVEPGVDGQLDVRVIDEEIAKLRIVRLPKAEMARYRELKAMKKARETEGDDGTVYGEYCRQLKDLRAKGRAR